MKKILFAAALALVLPVEASAQPVRACEPRVAIGAAVGLLTLDIPVDPVLAGVGRHGLATTTGNGLEASLHGAVPISVEWNLTAELGAGRMAVVQERDAAGEYVTRKAGDMNVHRLAIGLLRRRGDRMACRYVGGAAGLYRYSYRGTALNVPGVAAMMGFEAPRSGSVAWFAELGLSVALTKLQAPTAAEVVVNIRPAFGFHYRF